MELALQLKRAVQCLKAGRSQEAVKAFRTVLEHPDFVTADHMEDVRARSLCLYAQALLDTSAFADARQAAESALALTKKLGDTHGEKDVRTLLMRISSGHFDALRRAGHTRRQDEMLELPLGTLLDADKPVSEIGTLLEQAALKLRREQPQDAKVLAHHVVANDDASPKDQVIAWLIIAHAAPLDANTALKSAWELADTTNDTNLLKAVAQTAEQMNQSVAVLTGPQMGN